MTWKNDPAVKACMAAHTVMAAPAAAAASDLANMKKAELEVALTAQGISFEPRRRLDTLRKMLAEAHGGAAAAAARPASGARPRPPPMPSSKHSSRPAHRATASHSQATRHPQTQRGRRIVPALPPLRATLGRACSHRRHPPTSKFSLFSHTQRLSAPSCRPYAPHHSSWHPRVFEHAWARPHRGRAPSARRQGSTQGHAPCLKPPETRAAATTRYLQRRERALQASGAYGAEKESAADMKPPILMGESKPLGFGSRIREPKETEYKSHPSVNMKPM